MAIYHLSAKPISRAQGRSATGAAAYRAGVVIADERTGLVHDYTRKGGVLHSELILPGGGIADQAEFWNRIETHHKRGDAVLAREIEISLPTELTTDQRHALAVSYARELADRYNVAADVALHAPRMLTNRDFERDPHQYWEVDQKNGRRHNGNWHAHIMLSACHVLQDGTLGKKAVELDPIHCQRHKIENMADRERGRWCDLVNAALADCGQAIGVDHRSLDEQGIDRRPTKHLGPQALSFEEKTHKPSRRQLDILREADERLLRAYELGELERQIAEVEQQIIVLDSDISAALAERDAELRRIRETDIRERHNQGKPLGNRTEIAGSSLFSNPMDNDFDQMEGEDEQQGEKPGY